MLQSLQLEILDRFTAVEEFYRKSAKRGELSQTVKGLVFVQIYAIYEYTTKEVTHKAIQKISTYGHSYSELIPGLLAIFLDPEIKSLRDLPDSAAWKARITLFERAASNLPVTAVATMPHDGSYFKHTQANLILKALGVRRTLTVRRQHPYRIDEVVEHRNSIAHGAETARNIGRRYSRHDVWKRIRLMKAVCLRLISLVTEHCDLPERHCR